MKKTWLAFLVLAALLAGAAVSFAGLIGFVGLIVPHIMRRLVGSIHRYLIPVSIFGAGTLLLIADTLSRVLFAPYELPVGILMSLAGGPFFIFLILSKRRRLP
ncbi:MAG: iron chelate uptake ABC transporter family permease subunit [Clostridia bacterium]|nr:iron chelate uptake ABC transporter family permease subunit [Clostridia bacterium]